MAATARTEHRVEVGDADLPLRCPTPRTNVWCSHPRVFLDVARAGEVRCPYCGTMYVYRGKASTGH